MPLPTYPFQRQRYWLESTAGALVPAALGQSAAGHPFLAAAIEDPSGEGAVLTGRISLQPTPGWPTTPLPVPRCCPAPPSPRWP